MTAVQTLHPGVRTAAPSRALRYLPATALGLDATIIALTCAFAAWGHDRLVPFLGEDDLSSLTIAGPLVAGAWILTIAGFGSYRADVLGAGIDEYKRVINATLVTGGLLGVGCYLSEVPLSRGFFLLLFGVGVPALTLGRFTLRRALHRARVKGLLGYRVLIAGGPSYVDEIAAVLRREAWLGYHVEGALVPRVDLCEETLAGIPVVGTTDDVTDLVRESGVDIIFFAGGALTSASDLRRIAWDLEQDDVQVVIAPSVTDVSGERVRIRPVGGLPLIHLDPPRSTDAAHWGKRLFDIVNSAILLVLLSPLFLVAAVSVHLHDHGPILFRQTRTGRNGAQFSCLKFRTMVVDAEERLAELHAAAGYTTGLFKMPDDPRVTRPGRWLRRYSIDELPQLVNVIRGEMSLVGPRPPLPSEVEIYEEVVHRRLQVRPGLTGLWQVSGRSDLADSEAIRLDLYYVDNWSMLQDLNILAKTVTAVLKSDGAY